MTEPKATTRTRAPRSRSKTVPAAQFSAQEPEQPVNQVRENPPQPVQMPPGFVNGERAYETTPEPSGPRCVARRGCNEVATLQVVGKRHIRFCARDGAEFEVRQAQVVEGRMELEPIR